MSDQLPSRYNKPLYRVLSDKEVLSAIKSSTKASKKQIENVIKTYNTNLYKQVIQNRDGVDLPEFLGHLFIGACEEFRSCSAYDYKKTGMYNTPVIHRNLETEGLVAKIFYTTHSNKYKFKHHSIWGFTGYRHFTRATSKEFKKNYNRYIRIYPRTRVYFLYKSALK